MDAATLYMIATMPNGEMRARAYTQESASYVLSTSKTRVKF